jgi:hypothetical protein
MSYRVLNRDVIDDDKWNSCITNSVFGRIYALTWYLDCLSDEWIGYVWGDYLSVMPLVLRKKLGLKFVINPIFCQHLGFFSKENRLMEPDRLLKVLSKKFLVAQYSFIMDDVCNVKISGLKKRTNFFLELNKPYDEIHKSYSKNHRKNVRRSQKEELELVSSIDTEMFYQMLESFYYSKGIKSLKRRSYKQIYCLLKAAMERGCGELYFVRNIRGDITLGIFLFKLNERYTILTANTSLGYKTKSTYFALDEIIKQKSDSKCIVDFGGSDIKEIADFNIGFGSQKSSYYQFENRLILKGHQLAEKIKGNGIK